MKKMLLILIAASSISTTYTMQNDSSAEVKKAFSRAALRCSPRWAVDRTALALLGVLSFLPPLICAVSVLDQNHTPISDTVYDASCASSCVTIPTGIALLVRQPFLVSRDLNYVHSFTRSTAHINLANFPTVQELDQVRNYNQLLNYVADYTRKEGNLVERASILTPGLRGYDHQDRSRNLLE